ncbi:MAG: hypothetical protein AAGU11_02950 [Syntrophobacteraceae bacterium]
MSLKKVSGFMALVAIPLMAGLLMVSQAGADQNMPKSPWTSGMIMPGERDSGPLSIVPADDSTTKMELRRILFGRDKDKSEADRDASKKSDWDKDAGTGAPHSYDKDKESYGEGNGQSAPRTFQDSRDRDSGDANLQYVLWPFSSDKSTDADKQDSLSDQDRGLSDQDTGTRDKDAFGEGHSRSAPRTFQDSRDRDSGDATLQYVIWPFSSDKSTDADKQDSLADQDSSLSDQDRGTRDMDSGIGRDQSSSDLETPSADMDRDMDRADTKFIADETSDAADRDKAEDAEAGGQSAFDKDNQPLILAGADMDTSGSARSGMNSGSVGSGMRDLGTGDTSRQGSSKNGGSSNMMDRDTGGMSDRGSSTMDQTRTMDKDSSTKKGMDQHNAR